MGVSEIKSGEFRERPPPPEIFSKEQAMLGAGQGGGMRS